MGANTSIEWCHHTFNVWRGCTKVSAGCANCYAETQSKRNPSVLGIWGDNGTRVVAAESYWKQPHKWNRDAKAAGERRRVFSLSLGDWLEDRPELVAPRTRLLATIHETPHLDWLLLTKRPENWERLLRDAIRFRARQCVDECQSDDTDNFANWMRAWLSGEPPANIWIGVSVENNKVCLERTHFLRQIPARIRFISAEPLLENIAGPDGNLNMAVFDRDAEMRRMMCGPMACNREQADSMVARPVDLVIVGGESGPKARPFDLAWARSIRDQCKAAGVAFFMKQLGNHATWDGCGLVANNPPRYKRDGQEFRILTNDPKGGDMAEWPEDLRVRELPEVANG